MQRYSSVTLHVSRKKPNFSGEIEKKLFLKFKFCPEIFFLSGLVQNKLKLYVFEMDFMTIQLKMTVPKKCGFPSWKGSNIWSSDHCFEVQNTILKVLFSRFSTRQRHITSYSPNRSPCSIFTEFFFPAVSLLTRFPGIYSTKSTPKTL